MSRKSSKGKDPKEPRSGARARERARSQEEPGAHSGAESPAQDRAIPGTASSREGYQTEGGTAHDEALKGVEKQDEDR
ncbi:hypothetical protein [Streptomyces himalayensis]|uniref:Uncharacterized protein n=1 Tax=Streptomyces himalayensis subsp. himalayensis TaxID=2756131 RepID=A0A7W0DLM8_9ACTN|nr:hypothetical protein [Streptomyces himalayensis]MBA2947384.1 hypothetical protein [Streptomyces himalayensis subsp. himalayensis]